MAERRAPALHTIPAHRAFSDALAKGLLALHGGIDGGLTLARGIVLLPNNRAIRAVRERVVPQDEVAGPSGDGRQRQMLLGVHARRRVRRQ